MSVKVYTGRKKITIPVKEKDFIEEPVKYISHYLYECVQTNEKNKKDCEALQKVYLGEQKILYKRRINADTNNNNVIVINHSFRHVEFKKGFTVGNPIEYSMAVDNKKSDDLSVLTKYFNDCDKAEKDIDKYEDLYKFGYALQFIIPKTEEYEEDEAPFELYNLPFGSAFKVYSNDVTSKPLFDVVVSSKLDEKFNTKTVYEVYVINKKDKDKSCYLIEYEDFKVKPTEWKKQPYNYLPLIQYSLNKNMIGIVEIGLLLQHALNLIQSNQLDNVIDFVNSYIVFENIDTKKDWESAVSAMRKTRTIKIKSANPQMPAKVYTLKDSLSHTEITSLYEIVKRELYDIVAVPQSSGNVTSGGDTGEARILGNGWESAQNQAKVDTTYVSQFERELLKKVFKVAKLSAKNKLEDISPNEIAIKFSINMSNNILTKTQALSNLYNMNMPYEESLTIAGITSDIHGVGKKWQERDEKIKSQANQATTVKKTDEA